MGPEEIVYSKTAQKALVRMPRNWALRIRATISAYAADPVLQANNVKALQGMDGMLRLTLAAQGTGGACGDYFWVFPPT